MASPQHIVLSRGAAQALLTQNPALAKVLNRPGTVILSRSGKGLDELPNATTAPSYKNLWDFEHDLAAGKVHSKTAIFDMEGWSATPAAQQARPEHFQQLFVQMARAHGITPMLAPGRSLAPGQYIQSHQAARAATAFMRGGVPNSNLTIQTQANEWQPKMFGTFFNQALAQARARDPHVLGMAGISEGLFASPSAAALHRDLDPLKGKVGGLWLSLNAANQNAVRNTAQYLGSWA